MTCQVNPKEEEKVNDSGKSWWERRPGLEQGLCKCLLLLLVVCLWMCISLISIFLMNRTITMFSASVPVGFIYVQLPKQKEPSLLWPDTKWTDMSYLYGGVFFRVLGEDSAPFEQEQEGTCPLLDQVSISTDEGTPEPLMIPANGSWSSYIMTSASFVHSSSYRGMRFRLSKKEVRPRNQAVKVWQRVA